MDIPPERRLQLAGCGCISPQIYLPELRIGPTENVFGGRGVQQPVEHVGPEPVLPELPGGQQVLRDWGNSEPNVPQNIP